ncbi:glycosyltransferase family 2 protein [Stieleria sp. TO1_6]|uniref:glycosyltransferase n=1 Tax=Stieleria tagensis TaxID=2956795 RepID=UPI00209A6F04|nr:glycosyltransferase family 2 protein [Stieleria tagensis]MCO8120670.1 glycosyltransferase family 2 protein [Stieleria tagensis]
MNGEYCIIVPCRDEEAYARTTLDALVNQSVLPALVLIVDDGSTDSTPEILAEYAQRYDFVQVITRTNRGARKVGPGVIDAFYAGYDSIDPQQFEYVCKLDLDLDIPHDYFENLIQRMRDNPRLGTCSGKPFYPGPSNLENSFTGELISEACGDEMSVGMIKFYRRECFDEIGGFVREVMWDGIDCHRCRMLGWIAESYNDPELRFIHLRAMGSSQSGILTGRMRHGFGQWFMGTSLTYMTASSIFRMTRQPYVIGGMAMWWGYVRSLLSGKTRYGDLEFRRYLRNYQWKCLIHGKSQTTTTVDRRNEDSWWQTHDDAGRRVDPRHDRATDPVKRLSKDHVTVQ